MINLHLLVAVLFGIVLRTNAQTTGPKKGSLLIVGGGNHGEKITQKFIELAGGVHSDIVIIPTALGENAFLQIKDDDYLIKAGASKTTILHTTDKKIANSDSFVQPLKSATAVWFEGGRQWRLVDAYIGTKTEQMLWEVLERGGVIAGTSAGATIQGSYLVRGDTKGSQIMMGDHEVGFGFIQNVAIDQHVIARNRQFDMFNILQNRPELLGIGIDEKTAIIVKGDQFEVLGPSYVIVYDGTFWSRERINKKKLLDENLVFYFLREGDKYNMKKSNRLKFYNRH
ncbi:MAG: cyanophycinase [Reichenbachiella sp.]